MIPIISTVQMVYSVVDVKRILRPSCILVVVILAYVPAGCSDDAGAEGEESRRSGDTRVLNAKETKRLLRRLPFRYEFRKVPTPKDEEAAVAGKVFGRYNTMLNFGIALGRGHHGVPVPRAGTLDSYGYPRGGFIFTGDSLIRGPRGRIVANPRFRTRAQWREAGHMEVMMTDKLCLAATGEHCPP
jgi:hypothetical protein